MRRVVAVLAATGLLACRTSPGEPDGAPSTARSSAAPTPGSPGPPPPGSPPPAAPGRASTQASESAPPSCDAGRIVFTSERDGNRELYATCPDGSKLERLTHEPGDDHAAVLAPDGTMAVVRTLGHGGEPGYSEVVLVGAPGAWRPLAPARKRLRNPTFGADARTLVVEADFDGFSDLYRFEGEARVRLTRDPAGSFEPALAPDGRTLVFVSSRDGDAELYRMTIEGKDVLRLTRSRGDDVTPSWSPDGRRLAFTSTRRGPARVHVMEADGSRPRALDDVEVVGEGEPAWSPDGTRLAYVATRPDGSSLRVARVDDGALLFEDRGPYRDETPAWSPDGRWLVFASDREGDVELYLVPAGGGAVQRLTRSRGVDFLPRWQRPAPR